MTKQEKWLWVKLGLSLAVIITLMAINHNQDQTIQKQRREILAQFQTLTSTQHNWVACSQALRERTRKE